MDRLTNSLQTLGYNVKIGNFNGCKYVSKILDRIQIIIKLCESNEKLLFLYVGIHAQGVLQAFSIDESIDFVIFFTDNYIYRCFENFDTIPKLRRVMGKCDDDCAICLDSITEKYKHKLICPVCLSSCCEECYEKLKNSNRCPVCRSI